MKTKIGSERIPTGVKNLDAVLSGGLLKNTITVLAGTPGSGKTILSQQIAFKNASADNRILIFQTLSEPTAKTLRYLQNFSFYDPQQLEKGNIEFIDLGDILRIKGLSETNDILMKHVKRVKPTFIIIDSFRAFGDLAKSEEELRKFSYEAAINFMSWECTTLLLGEFNSKELETNPLFSIVDGIISLKLQSDAGEEQRSIQVIKMRGTNHSRAEQAFDISSSGLTLYTPRITIRRKPKLDLKIKDNGPIRSLMGISMIDKMLGGGIPYGSSMLVSGVSGTGKTILLLEFIYRGAKDFGEKGIFFSFEETTERLISNAKGMGWDIESEIKKGNIEIVFIEQTEIRIEKHLEMMKESIEKFNAKRIAIDSSSIFVHKIDDPHVVREKVFQLGTIVQNAQAIGLFATDISYGTNQISRFGVEETIVDGIILLSSTETGLIRERFIEIYKLRNTNHVNGRHQMKIEKGGIIITSHISSKKKSKKAVKKTRK